MALRDQIMQLASQDPNLQKAVDAMEAQLAGTNIVPEDLDEAIKVLESVLMNPNSYAQVRQMVISQGLIPEDMVPVQFDAALIVSLLIALYGLQDRLKQRFGSTQPSGMGMGMGPQNGTGPMAGGPPPMQMQPGQIIPTLARGGLASLGRGGDTELVHVNRREKEMLHRMGGTGEVNPNTGLREYKGGFWKTFSAIAPVALMFVPGIGTAIGGALTGGVLGATGSAVVGGAALGAGTAAIGGNDPLKGAAFGAIGGGLGKAIGSGVNSAVGGGISSGMQNVIGSGVAGAGMGALTGDGAAQGALRGVAGGVIGNAAGELGSNVGDRWGDVITGAGRGLGNAITGGASPSEAAIAGLTGGISAGLTYESPNMENISGQDSTRLAVDAEGNIVGPAEGQLVYGTGEGGRGINDVYTTGIDPKTGATTYAETPATYSTTPDGVRTAGYEPLSPNAVAAGAGKSTGLLDTKIPGTGISLGTAATVGGLGALALGSFSSPEEEAEVTEAVSSMSPTQQEYFAKPLTTWDWNAMKADASQQGLDLGQYMARNWDVVRGGKYDVVAAAKGGALSQMRGYAKGSGSGRADTINARLSDGEFVIDAETVALLGDGSSEEGARVLNRMRREIRQQKGKALVKGKFSPNAKSPLTYIKEKS